MLTEDIVRETIRVKIRRCREILGVTQVEMSRMLRVHDQTVPSWENGKGVGLKYLVEYSNLSGLPMSWFYEDIQQPAGQKGLGDIGTPIPAGPEYDLAHPSAGTEVLPGVGPSASVDPDILEQLRIAQDALDKMRAQLTKGQPKLKKAK